MKNLPETLTVKQRNEQLAFARFAHRMGTNGLWISVTNRPAGEPDLLCVHVTDGSVAIELVSLTDPNIARVQAAGPKAYEDAFYTSDPSERIVRDKLSKKYASSVERIELLIYTDGQIILPDDAIIQTILPLFDALPHPFNRVWFMGQSETCCLWNASPHASSLQC